MGFNPFKAVKKAVKGITKPFKKVLRSPIGKVAGLAALYYGAPMLGGYGAGGAGWKKMLTAKAPWLYKNAIPGVPHSDPTGILASLGSKWSSMGTLGKAATVGAGAMATGAMGDDVLEESKTVVDTSGHEGYLNARKGFVDEWTEWLVNQGHDEVTARAMAEKELFTANEGGLAGRAQGGRIGLYAGGMGVMNNPMNPMMNRGLGAMGSPGMNPYNQQNLMAQGQMRGNPMMGGNPMMARGNPMMGQRPGIPAQGPGISSTQAAASLAKKEEDSDLLKLIRMLASMGIPMEQLRGRTKEELVEMAISLQKDQPTGRPEVVEESEEVEEEVMTAAGGGRVRAAGGLGETYPPPGSYPNSDLEFQTEEQASSSNPGNAEMYLEEDEEEEIYIPQEKNPFERQGMEFDKPVGREGTFRADNPPVMYSLNKGGLMRTRYAMGSEQPVIPSKDGPQIDYRDMGGYQPHGKKEKHDDVRALLAQGEFVVTSDAVKGIGGGDRDLGAKRMYDMMHKYEPIGRALS